MMATLFFYVLTHYTSTQGLTVTYAMTDGVKPDFLTIRLRSYASVWSVQQPEIASPERSLIVAVISS